MSLEDIGLAIAVRDAVQQCVKKEMDGMVDYIKSIIKEELLKALEASNKYSSSSSVVIEEPAIVVELKDVAEREEETDAGKVAEEIQKKIQKKKGDLKQTHLLKELQESDSKAKSLRLNDFDKGEEHVLKILEPVSAKSKALVSLLLLCRNQSKLKKKTSGVLGYEEYLWKRNSFFKNIPSSKRPRNCVVTNKNPSKKVKK